MVKMTMRINRRRWLWLTVLVLGAPAWGQSLPGWQTETPEQARALVERLRRTDRTDAASLLAAAQWCESQAMWQPAGRLYRRVLSLQPTHDAAYDRLMRLTLTHGLFDPPGRTAALQREFGPGFGVYRSNYFVVVHDRPEAWAASRARLLEITRKRFLGTFSQRGFKPLPLGQRLVCLSFAKFNEFREYARKTDGRTGDWFRGYYSGRTNRIAFFDVETAPEMAERVNRLHRLDDRLADLRRRIEQAEAGGDRGLADRLRNQVRHVQRERTGAYQQWQQIRGLVNISHAIHEATHQLAFNTELQKRGVMYPMWFSEGLATSFETIAPAAPFGPDHDNPYRRRVFEQANQRGQALPYNRLVAMVSPPSENEQQLGSAYAQSWALFVYLFNRQADALRRYCFYKRAQKPGRLDEATLLKEFETFFGDPDEAGRQAAAYVYALSRQRR